MVKSVGDVRTSSQLIFEVRASYHVKSMAWHIFMVLSGVVTGLFGHIFPQSDLDPNPFLRGNRAHLLGLGAQDPD